jgi:hypothetical protein
MNLALGLALGAAGALPVGFCVGLRVCERRFYRFRRKVEDEREVARRREAVHRELEASARARREGRHG